MARLVALQPAQRLRRRMRCCERRFATLLMDLLTRNEARDRRNVFDIPLLAERVVEAIDWAAAEPALERICRSASSARARARPRRWSPRRNGRRMSRRRLARRPSRSRRRGAGACARADLLIVGGLDYEVSRAESHARRDVSPTRGSTSCLERRIYSRSRARWSASWSWRRNGSRRSWRDADRRLNAGPASAKRRS